MKKKKNKKIELKSILLFILAFLIFLISDYMLSETETEKTNTVAQENNTIQTETNHNLSDDLTYSGQICIDINNNEPFFEEKDLTEEVFEIYSNLDDLGRCGVAYANVCKDIMPKEGEKRGKISYKPTGWVQTIYNNGQALYNRSHLIAWQLGDENDNERNLITGTRQMNEAMIPWENQVANWVKQQNKEGKDYHVLYRVTPHFIDTNLVANGVEMEAKSVEDNGKGICFNKYIFNIQEGFEINYATGENKQIQ